MSYNIRTSGLRAKVREDIVAQVDSAILMGQATPEVKVAALAIVDAVPSEGVINVVIDGHTDAANANFTCMVTT
jgi:flagellar motor protein MotB